MPSMLVYPAGSTEACHWAAHYLTKQGVSIVDHPTPDATHLLLDVPSLSSEGTLRGGGDLKALLSMLPTNITIVGGNLSGPYTAGHPLIDLLQDPEYLAKNAAITADCAMRIAGQNLPIVFSDCCALVIGWGRIGKCLAKLLKAVGAKVIIAARNPDQRAMAQALGYSAIDTTALSETVPNVRLVFNTVPAMVLRTAHTQYNSCICIELASRPGIAGENVVLAPGLPGKMAPESSGALICSTFLKLAGRK